MSEYGDLINQSFGLPKQQARISAVASADDDPEKAARAIQLGNDADISPSVVYGDIEGFEKTHKARLAGQIIENNPHLQDYINSHPLAAKISNDDWAQLDIVSEKLKHFEDTTFLGSMKNFAAGAAKELNKGPIGQWILDQPGGVEFAQKHPASFIAWQMLGSPIEVPMRLLNAFIEGGATSVGRATTAITGNEDLGRGIEEIAPQIAGQYFVGRMSGQIKPLHVTAHNTQLKQATHESLLADIKELSDKIKPYTDAEQVPPVGIDPKIDQFHAKQARADIKALDEADKEFQKSATFERSPEMAAAFAELKTKANIGISFDAIQALYGDKPVHPEDGILGHIPGIVDRLRAAEAAGGDVDISMPNWLAWVDPEVKKALHDDVRVRSGGMTLNEAKELAEQKKALEPLTEEESAEPIAVEPSDLVRGQAALKPLFEEGPTQQLRLRKLTGPDKTAQLIAGEADAFHITDEKGKRIGDLQITPQFEGKDLHVEWIGGSDLNAKGGVDNIFGPKLVRGLLSQLKAEYPKAEFISGNRVSGARLESGKTGQVRIPLKALTEEAVTDLGELLKQGEWIDYSGTTSAKIKPTEFYTEHEQRLVAAVDDLLKRVTPKQLEGHQPAVGIRTGEEGRYVAGIYQRYTDRLPLILWSLNSPDALGTGRHEALHHLRQQGFFTRDEWAVLQRAVLEEGWLDKYNIRERYAHLGAAGKIEEAIADAFKNWNREKADTAVGKIFEKLKDLLDGIRSAIREILGKEPTFEDLFRKVESGEIGSREGAKPLDPRAFAQAEEEPTTKMKQGELAVTRQEDLEIFEKAAVIGMTAPQYKKYMKLIEQRNVEDIERQQSRAREDERRRQTKEWKDNEAKIRDEVRPEIEARPDVAVGAFFRNGILYGEDTHKRPKLSGEGLTEEQRKSLASYISDNGMHPDDVAGLFGYQSGTELVEKLSDFEKARGDLPYSKYLDKIVAAEVEKRMQKEFGDLEKNILSEAQDHVISDTQMDLLHEETVALGMRAGAEMPFSKGDIKAWVKQSFDDSPISSLKVDKFLDNAGKAGRAAELALLKDDPTEAFRQKQRQYYSMLLAKEAKKLEKELARFEKTAKQFSKREVPSVPQEYTNFIHDILMRTGNMVRRSIQDLQETIANGEYKNLEDFVAAKEADLREVPIAEFLLDENFAKPLTSLTAAEFRAVHDSIKSLITNGRDERKIIKAGEEADLAEIRDKMVEQLSTFKERHYPASEGKLDKLKHIARTYLVSHLQLESLFNRWDRGDPQGTFTQYIMRGLASSANYESALERKYSRMLTAIADKADLKEKIENSIFIDPLSKDEDGSVGVPMLMTRKNLRAIMQNVGNASNLDKLARGYSIEPQAILDWINKHATAEDWKWVQAQGDIFAEIKKEADTMYRNLTGIEPESILLRSIDTPHGTLPGWYHPIVYHPVWEGSSKRLMGGDPLEQDNYIRATTPRGYTKQRTPYAAPLSLDLDQTPIRMKQMIHDIAFRPEVINASKIFYDKDIRAAITKHYGKEYRDLLIPYLRDVANSGNYRSDAAKVGTMVSEFMRQNIIAALIGLNPGTVMKHGPTAAINSLTEVGPLNFLKAVKGLMEINQQTGQRNWTFAMETSEELQRRSRHYIETFKGAQEEVLGTRTLRDTMISIGSAPVAMSDLLSAVPTWMAQYERSMREGSPHGEAVFMADRAVRRAHGSSVITNRPALMRGGPMAQWMASLYGFFSHILNRQYELMWNAGDTLGLVKKGEYADAAKKVPLLTWGFFSYILFPALIEELVTPLSNNEKESWGVKAAKGLAKGLSSSWIGIRDIASAALSGHDPTAGLLSTSAKTATDLYRDLAKDRPLSKQHAGNIIQHGTTAFGALTGLTNAQEGRVGKFIYNYTVGNEKPRGFHQWWHGIRYGTIKEQKR